MWLEGEAFFDVVSKVAEGQKFVVNTNELKIEVLGTAFNVNTHRNKSQVYLKEGKVKVVTDDQEMLMSPGEEISTQTNKLVKSAPSKNFHLSWLEGVAMFQEAPLIDIINKIEELYGVEFTVNDNAYFDKNFTMGIPINNLETALDVLSKISALELTRNDLQITIE